MIVALLLVYVLVWLPLAALRALVIVQLWSWFVVPQFSVAPLTIPTAMGLVLIVSLFWKIDPDEDSKVGVKERIIKLGGKISLSVSASLVTLALGWAVKQL